LGYTIELLPGTRHRYITRSQIVSFNTSQKDDDVITLIDTGAFNTMIDLSIAERFVTMLPLTMPISIGGNLGEAQGCIIHKFTLGTNIMNNWDFTTSRTDNMIKFTENIPPDAPNKRNPYQNYFRNGEYVAVQDEILIYKE
jgi:hypothetical protein